MERTPEEIAKDIDATREQLVDNIDEIAGRLQPEEIAKRTAAKVEHVAKDAAVKAGNAAKDAAVQAEVLAKSTSAKIKAYYTDEVSGEIRQDRAMKTGAIAFGLLVLRKLLK